jgi:hypothetical protein
MSEPHEEIARRLAELGRAQAPSDLRGEVMAQVTAEPRRRPRRSPTFGALLRPATRIALVASVVLAAGVGIAHLGGGSSTSSPMVPTGSRVIQGAPQSSTRGSAVTLGNRPFTPTPTKFAAPSSTENSASGVQAQALIIDRTTARSILGRYYGREDAHGYIVARVPAQDFRAYSFQLAASALSSDSLSSTLDDRQFVHILLVAARDRRH